MEKSQTKTYNPMWYVVGPGPTTKKCNTCSGYSDHKCLNNKYAKKDDTHAPWYPSCKLYMKKEKE